MKRQHLLKSTLCLIMALVCNVAWAALGTTKTGTPENGKTYYIYADTYSGGAYVNRYLYDDNGTLKMKNPVDETSDNYVWSCVKSGDKYTFQNVGTGKWLAHKAVANAAYNFTLGKANANHEGTTIWSDAADRYLVAKNDGSKFDQANTTYNQASGDWCTDYVFVECLGADVNKLTITANCPVTTGLKVNGVEATYPYVLNENNLTGAVTITGADSNPYKFVGFFQGDENKGKSVTVNSLKESVAYEARYELNVFSASTAENDLVPVLIYSNRDNKDYAVLMKAADSYAGKAVNSGKYAYAENEFWYLVGTAESFKMYSRVAGTGLALKLAGTGQGSAATLDAEGTELCLVAQTDGSFGICPKTEKGQSFNMFGGAGADIKLYGTSDSGSKWLFRRIDLSKALTLNYNAQLEGGYEGNYKIGEIAINIAGIASSAMLEKTTIPTSSKCYLPEGAVFGISKGFMCHGWTIDFNGKESIPTQALPEGGLAVDVNIAVDKDNKYQYLYHTPNATGKPYRIPAIATAVNGDVFAIADYRPCGNDIGYGEVDIKCRISKDNGETWGEEFFVADGKGGDTNEMTTGYGDAAIVADCQQNKLLVMMVCGKTVCHNGRWDKSKIGNKKADAVNRVARVYATYNEETEQWDWTEPVEVTDEIYSLFLDGETPTVTSMFIGSGKICQSRMVKKDQYYRLYCSMWTRDGGNRVIYSDDFGQSWKVLGTIADRPAPGGDEPKCEELPDGSVLLSSRKGSGRYFNVFRYSNVAEGQGKWEGVVATDQVGDLKWGGNSTNGEPLRIGNVLFQSAPTGNGRSDVSLFYKVLSNDPADYTPTKLSNGWTEIEISDEESAYSTMTVLANGNIGFYYEEAPGGYSMVYVPLDLKKILPANVYDALSGVPPTYSAASTPVWNYVQFAESGKVLSDLGNGSIATADAEEVDNNMWAVVGSRDQFYLMSKLGNYLAYDATTNCYIASANKKDRVALTLNAAVGGLEIMRKGGDKVMSEGTTAVVEAPTGAAANKVNFVDLTPVVYDPNIFSTEEAPVYYQVQFKAGGCYIFDQGDGQKLTTKAASEVDGQFWQFIGTPEEFYMKSRSGNYVFYSDNRFTASATNKTALYVLASNKGGKGYYEIGRKGSTYTFNQHGGAGADKELAEYNVGDVNNPLRFVGNEEVVALPYFSTVEAPKYWWLKFCNGGAALADKGAGKKAMTATQSFTDAQLWQLVGDESGFYMKNKAGNYLTWKDSRFQTSAAEADKATLLLHNSSNAHAEEAGCYEIQPKGDSYNMNQVGGAGAGKELATWGAGDPNNHFVFVSAEPTYPVFNNEEAWYYIQFGNGKWVIEDKGADANVKTASLDDLNTQRWRVTGGIDSCQIISQEGHYLVCKNNYIQASTEKDPKGFTLAVTTHASYPLYLEIQHRATKDKAFNMDGGAGKDKNIALYNANDGGNPLLFVDAASVEYPEFSVAESAATAPTEKLSLWYTQPATATGVSNTWMEYSLPLGNGQFGASLFGGVAKDEILFNDKTLWSGGPNEYGYYLPFGSVYIEDISEEFTYNETKQIKNYYRDLNLATATGTVSYEDANGVKYTRQYIASNPDKAIVTKITASEKGKLSYRITMESGKPTVKAETTYQDGYAQFTGKLQTVSYNATLKVVAKGGYFSTGSDAIYVEEADEVLIVLMGCTDFVGNDASHVNGRAAMLPADNKAIVDAVAEKGWAAVYADHVADHQSLFNRVSLELDGVQNNLPTNELIEAYNTATGTRNHMLEQLYYQYGRYLAIAASRGADSPANLQGIWNNTCTPPWHSDIHANINVQMNYWPVEAGNLSEMHEPFVNYIINEAAQPEWRKIASNKGGKREDSWTLLTENNIFGGVSTFAPDALINNAWYVTHLWQHYRYTLDEEYLLRAFPAMKGAALFWVDRMVLAADGTYECPNEYSPEHGPGKENATAHAQQIVWECIDNTVRAAIELDAVEKKLISAEDYNLLVHRRKHMDRGLAIEEYEAHDNWPAERNGIKEGDKILREWKYSRFYASNDQGHRHMSHLMALYPFGQLTQADTVLFDAAINSMKLRGDASTGWSMGWKINLWARALMPERSHTVLRTALKHSTSYGTDQSRGGIYYNLFDSHAPFQIDGNFGATSGVQEMLMQSHTEVINILPALPAEWSKGSVKGLKAVGNFIVDFNWENGKAQKVTITSHAGSELRVSCAHGAKEMLNVLVTIDGEETPIEVTKSGVAMIPCEEGSVVVIDFTAVGSNTLVANPDPEPEPEPLPEPDPDASVEMPTANTNNVVVYYDLQGRRVMNPTKGIYIVGGRKVVIR